jgi:hypothetical protein
MLQAQHYANLLPEALNSILNDVLHRSGQATPSNTTMTIKSHFWRLITTAPPETLIRGMINCMHSELFF